MYKLIDILNEYKYSDDYTLGLAKQFKHMRDFKKAYFSGFETNCQEIKS